MNLKKNSKIFQSVNLGTIWGRYVEKTRAQKTRATVPLRGCKTIQCHFQKCAPHLSRNLLQPDLPYVLTYSLTAHNLDWLYSQLLSPAIIDTSAYKTMIEYV